MSEIHTYEIDGKSYQGFFASSGEQNAPCVLIAHAWACLLYTSPSPRD